MAEKATADYCYAVTFTYANLPSGDKPDGARIFMYSHFRQFMNSLEKSYKRKFKTKETNISWIVCGEHGSKYDRVHWHAVLFSDRDLASLSKFKMKGEEVDFKLDTRLNWGLWPHGFVHFLEPDRKGIAYCLKYAFKDQFNVVRSRGKARERNGDVFGAGLFRMSKRPPIGHAYVVRKLQEWRLGGIVPARLEISMPDYSGYWFPTGDFRQWFAERLFVINEERKERLGRDCPQWNTLMSSIDEEDETTKEALLYGPISQDFTVNSESEFERFKRTLYCLRPSDFKLEVYDWEAERQQCYSLLPCPSCVTERNIKQVADFCRKAVDWEGSTRYLYSELKEPCESTGEIATIFPVSRFGSAEKTWRDKGARNPFCKGTCSGQGCEVSA